MALMQLAAAPFLAALPLVVVLAAMIFLGLRAALAGAIGLALAFALLPLGFDLSAGGTLPLALATTGPLAEAVSAAAVILWIILPALALYELQSRAGALDRMRAALAALTPKRSLQVLLIAWFFGLFMEGAAGFGTPVALAAPLLVGLGLPPVRAVAVALLGHAPGVSFGAIGTPVFAQIDATGQTPATLALATAALHAPLMPVVVFAVLRLAKGARLDRSEVAWGLFAAVCFAVPSLALAFLSGPELATLGGALVGGGVFAMLLRQRRKVPLGAPGLLRDLTPYLLIVLLVLATRLIAPLQ
jgi:lactate permease